MKKRIVAAFLALVLCMGLAGCSDASSPFTEFRHSIEKASTLEDFFNGYSERYDLVVGLTESEIDGDIWHIGINNHNYHDSGVEICFFFASHGGF